MMNLAEIFKITFQVLIAVFGVIGNVLVILVIRRLGKKKQQADLYVQNLAIADLGVLLLTFPMNTLGEKVPFNWPLGEFTCRLLKPVPEIFYGASVWFIALIAIERYRKLVKVKTQVMSRHKTLLRRATTAGVCTWVASFLIYCLPLYFVFKYGELPNGGKWCGPVWPSWDRQFIITRVYIVSQTLFSYILPLIVISITYLAVSRTLRRSSSFIHVMNQDYRGGTENKKLIIKSVRLKQNERAKKILTSLVIVFAITMLPVNSLRLTIAFWPAIHLQDYYENLLFIVGVFVILNSSTNPLIYSVVSKVFRRRIKDLCLRRKS